MRSNEIRAAERYVGVLLQFMEGRSYKPLTFKQLCDRLDIPEDHLPQIRAALKALRKAGRIHLDGRRYLLTNAPSNLVGTIRILPRGFGFVRPKDRSAFAQDIFIPPPKLAGAADGDTVEVEVNRASLSDPRGPEGSIVAILNRGRQELAGTVVGAHSRTLQEVLVPTVEQGHTVLVKASGKELPVGSRVLLHVEKWGSAEKPTLCSLKKIIGHIRDPATDVPAALSEYSLRTSFSEEALLEARSFGSEVTELDLVGREDLRALPCITIDPASARDFDDALTLKRDRQGHYLLWVHIADVSHYVRPESSLDKEAALRCNSTYFPGTCIPMLPPELADNLCSLKPGVDRLSITVALQFDKTGELMDYSVSRSVIHSAHRYTYEEVGALLAAIQDTPHPHGQMLAEMAQLGQLLRERRRVRGSMEFTLPEINLEIDASGQPMQTRLVEYDLSHQLVEEFMLKANEVIATHLHKLGRGVTYRVHAPPSPEDLRSFLQLGRSLGFQLPKEPDTRAIQQLLDKAAASPLGHYVAVAYVRTLKLAVYSPDNIGHYGLSLEHYCHFTSPIRRYSDLLVHRVLFGEGPPEEELEALAERCSDQERLSARAENSVLELKKLRFVQKESQRQSNKEWDAVVTGVKPHGITFQILEIMLEGFQHVSQLGDDYYEFHPERGALIGVYSGKSFRVGSKLNLRVQQIDLIQRRVYWV